MSKETLGYRITFEVVEGEYAGKRFWHTIFLTPKSMPQAKRDLAKFGIASMDQLKQPLTAVFLCVVDLTVRQDGDYEGNRVRRFEVIGSSQLAPDVFAPESKLPMGTKEALAMDSVVQPKAEAVSPSPGRIPKKKKKPFSKSGSRQSPVGSPSVKVKGAEQ